VCVCMFPDDDLTLTNKSLISSVQNLRMPGDPQEGLPGTYMCVRV
jgi:hypothetical protein